MSHDAFGNWLSGFVDGEGCFRLVVEKRGVTPAAGFRIKLRADDAEILDEIRTWWGCGTLFRCDPRYDELRSNAKPGAVFSVHKTADLMRVVVPHFEIYPLRAKKSRDFSIWRQGVELVHLVQQRPQRGLGAGGGAARKWKPDDIERFAHLMRLLKDQRAYESPVIPVRYVEPKKMPLFESLLGGEP